MELKIFKEISPECLLSTSIYDFNESYFSDFYYNNKNMIISEDDEKAYEYIKLTSIYLNKLILHYEIFYLEKCSVKAVSCILTSIKIIDDYLKDKFWKKIRLIYINWVIYLIEQCGLNKKKVENLSNTIYNTYLNYQKSKSISQNLNRLTPLPYVKNKI